MAEEHVGPIAAAIVEGYAPVGKAIETGDLMAAQRAVQSLRADIQAYLADSYPMDKVMRATDEIMQTIAPVERLAAAGLGNQTAPASASSASLTGDPLNNSANVPSRSQDLPTSVSTTAFLRPSATARMSDPSYRTGSESTVPAGLVPAELALDMEVSSNRIIVQPAKTIDRNRQLAMEAYRPFRGLVEELAKDLPGVQVQVRHPRDKAVSRLAEKVAKKQPPETIKDYLAGRIIVDDPRILKTLYEHGAADRAAGDLRGFEGPWTRRLQEGSNRNPARSGLSGA